MRNSISIVIVLVTFFFFGACAQSEVKTETTGKKLEIKNNRYQDISAEVFNEKMANEDVVILDVRTDKEVAEGMIEGAIQIDFYSPDFNSKVLALDKDKEYLIYCRSGGRSGKACKVMQKGGFQNLSNLSGGYSSWPYKNK